MCACSHCLTREFRATFARRVAEAETVSHPSFSDISREIHREHQDDSFRGTAFFPFLFGQRKTVNAIEKKSQRERGRHRSQRDFQAYPSHLRAKPWRVNICVKQCLMLTTSGHCRSRPNVPFEPQHLAFLSDPDSKKIMRLHVVVRCVWDAAVARASLGH